MTLAQKLLKVIENISEDRLSEIIDFAEYIKEKESRETRNLIDSLSIEYDDAFKELAK